MDADRFEGHASGLLSAPTHAFAVTPDDETDLSEIVRGLMVATTGDVQLRMASGATIALPALLPGVQYAVRATRVFATGTTATGIVGLV